MEKNIEKHLEHNTRKVEFHFNDDGLNSAVSNFYQQHIHRVVLQELINSEKDKICSIEGKYGEHSFGIMFNSHVRKAHNHTIINVFGLVYEHAENKYHGEKVATYIESGRYSEPLKIWIIKKIWEGLKS